METHEGHNEKAPRQSSLLRWCAYISLAILAFYLISEHQTHLFSALPYLFLLACPLMHIFMHGSHHSGHDHKRSDSMEENKPQVTSQPHEPNQRQVF